MKIDNKLKSPKVVGFDIDDTLIHSELVFNLAHGMLDKDKEKWRSSELFRIIEEKHLDCVFAHFKSYIMELLAWYLKKGVSVFLITARTYIDKTTDFLFDMIKRELMSKYDINDTHLKNLNEILYVGSVSTDSKYTYSKTSSLVSNKVDIFFGDSDLDMDSAQEAGILAVRVERLRTDFFEYSPGKYSEYIFSANRELIKTKGLNK